MKTSVERFDASGWHTQRIDGHDTDAIADAIRKAQQDDRPSLIACRTIIAFGAPTKAGTAAAHGSPLGKAEIAGTRERLGWTSPPFVVPDDLAKAWRKIGERGKKDSAAWRERHRQIEPAGRIRRRNGGDAAAGGARRGNRAQSEIRQRGAEGRDPSGLGQRPRRNRARAADRWLAAPPI